jgi:hypothetical protein
VNLVSQRGAEGWPEETEERRTTSPANGISNYGRTRFGDCSHPPPNHFRLAEPRKVVSAEPLATLLMVWVMISAGTGFGSLTVRL